MRSLLDFVPSRLYWNNVCVVQATELGHEQAPEVEGTFGCSTDAMPIDGIGILLNSLSVKSERLAAIVGLLFMTTVQQSAVLCNSARHLSR